MGIVKAAPFWDQCGGIAPPERRRPHMTRLYAGLATLIAVGALGFMGWKAVFDRPEDAFAQCRQGQVAGGDIGG